MADQASTFLSKPRYAVVTGGNKGIGLEICRQLASKGVVVVLTARNESRGREAIENLKKSGIPSDNLEFHQLDVTDPSSIASLADFIYAKLGKLDILVNNAGIIGAICDFDALKAAGFGTPGAENLDKISKMTKVTYEAAEECVKTNYYGVKRTTEALIPLLESSDSPRIVNVSSSAGLLKNIPSERARDILGNTDMLTEERIGEILNEFLEDVKEGSVETKCWPPLFPPYFVSKAAMNAYTRILAKKYPSIIINCVCPGYVKTDINGNTGYLTVEEGGESCVRLALLPYGSPSGLFYIRDQAVVTGGNKGIGLEICRQLASKGLVVVLTARNESRGRKAIENLKKSGIPSDNLEFHQLDVTDPSSIASLADFINAKFGKLDILMNNAGILGAICDFNALKADGLGTPGRESFVDFSKATTVTYEIAEECFKTNYYGVKRTTEALLPLLESSDSPRVVNVSSIFGLLKSIPIERVREVLGNAETLTEERIDEILNEFLKDMKEGSFETKGWPCFSSPYSISKAALNAYTRILAKKHPSIIINCLCPGFVKTDLNDNTGYLTAEQGGESCVRLALLPHGSPSGLFYNRDQVSSF